MTEIQELRNWAKKIKMGNGSIAQAYESFAQSFGAEKAKNMLPKLGPMIQKVTIPPQDNRKSTTATEKPTEKEDTDIPLEETPEWKKFVEEAREEGKRHFKSREEELEYLDNLPGWKIARKIMEKDFKNFEKEVENSPEWKRQEQQWKELADKLDNVKQERK